MKKSLFSLLLSLFCAADLFAQASGYSLVAAGGGTPTSITNGGATVAATSGGAITATTAAGQPIGLYGAAVRFDSPSLMTFGAQTTPAVSGATDATVFWDGANLYISRNGGSYVRFVPVFDTSGNATFPTGGGGSFTLAPPANTVVAGLTLTDTTAATSGNQQYSPYIYQTGQGWKTTATAGSQSVTFRQGVVPVQGAANPTGTWTLESSVNGGAYGNGVTVDTTGAISGNSAGLNLNAGGTNQNITLTPSGTGSILSGRAGTKSNVAIGTAANTGIYQNGAGQVTISGSGLGIINFLGGEIRIASNVYLGWNSTVNDFTTGSDTALYRNAAGVVEVNNGSAGTFRDIKVRTAQSAGTTYANLPTAAAGMMSYITDGATANCGDSLCTTWGTTVTGGGGALKLLVWYNGTNWTLMGK